MFVYILAIFGLFFVAADCGCDTILSRTKSMDPEYKRKRMIPGYSLIQVLKLYVERKKENAKKTEG